MQLIRGETKLVDACREHDLKQSEVDAWMETAHKLRDVARFRATVANYRLLPRPLVSLGAILLVVAEGAVVCALVVARW